VRWVRCIVVLVVAACGAEADAPPTMSEVPEGEFLAAYARAFCEPLAVCCRAASAPYDEAACIAVMKREGESALHVRAMYAVYDGRRARDCVETMRTFATNCLTSPAVENAWDATCKIVRMGTRVPGESCADDGDCAPSQRGQVRCLGALSNPAERTCVLDSPGRENEFCGVPTDTTVPVIEYHTACVDDLRCDDTKHCVPAWPDGAVCRSSRECLNASWCRPPDVTAPSPSMSHCEPEQPLGADCVFIDDQCTSGVCYEQKCATGKPLTTIFCPGR
jgi:hypothetical protein